MANLKEVRNRIVSITSTQQITKAMKMVSAAKLKRATDAIVQMRPYAEKLREILSNLSATAEGGLSPFMEQRSPKNILVIVVASNRGLAGAFNMNVIKATSTLINTKYSKQKENGKVTLITVGKKGYDFFSRRDYQILGENTDLFANLDFEHVSELADKVMHDFAEGKYDRVELVYNQFKNAAVQVLTTEQLLPLQALDNEHVETDGVSVDYILEPSQDRIIRDLIPKSIKIQLYKAVLDSHASEHGARMTAMDKATDNAGELLKSLKISYNRARQAAITTELTEIVSGAAALSEG
ncbi:ATP synthase F1 subunit gamma [Olivibacter sitiensis]|uniref:ATP synthase F1 subunit gamma n=1 Tax=Olivibacter sitiensis TaxID=376470 RepID=UPI0004826910|nr:ATP synthase F1 subunit gamma [Olivibacter sitiensis]